MSGPTISLSPQELWEAFAVLKEWSRRHPGMSYEFLNTLQEAAMNACATQLAEIEARLAGAGAELAWIDSVMARRPALDASPTRASKIELACSIAGKVDPKGELVHLQSELAEAHRARDRAEQRIAEATEKCSFYQAATTDDDLRFALAQVSAILQPTDPSPADTKELDGKFGPAGNMQGEDHPWRK